MKLYALLGAVVLGTASLLSVPAMAADPTLQEVYQAADAGRLKQAETMMDQVLRDHPNSAKAHFVDAEILAKDGLRAQAAAELRTAERLAPGLPFAKPAAVAELKAQLEAPQRAVAPQAYAPAPTPSVPWGLLLIGALLVIGVALLIGRARRAAGGMAPGAGMANPMPVGAGPYGAGYPQPVATPGGGIGSGILGGLATGAAVGAGVVAGEALMHRVLDGGEHASNDGGHLQGLERGPDMPAPDPGYDMGGNDFGVQDSGSWGDDSSLAGGGGGDDWS